MIQVVCGVVVEGKRVLMAQRSAQMEHPLKWEFPGGKVQDHESAAEALERELLEELKLEIYVIRALTEVVWKYPRREVSLQPLLCGIRQGKPRAMEHAAIIWCTFEELQKLDILEADVSIVKQIEDVL